MPRSDGDPYDAIHLASARETKRIVTWFDGEVRLLAFDAGLVQADRALGFAIPR